MYDIIFTQRKSIKNFNRSLTILGGVGGRGSGGSGGSGGRIAPDPPKGDKPEKDGRRWELHGR